HRSVLIFDEVMTGFRLSKGGAQELYRINADMVTFGKIIGGGMPVGAFGGKQKIMAMVSPDGPVYQAGTLSGNPVAMAAGYTMLKLIHETNDLYQELEVKGQYLEAGLQEVLTNKNIDFTINRVGSMISLHFTDQNVTNFSSSASGNNDTFKAFFHNMLNEGIYLPPSPFETWFLSYSLTKEQLDKTISSVDKVCN
ncbi:MAG: aminotransferase class III-fold pyridoxal phosphate-dependent enzyme, partial [Bacteroidetes bacterium]|nr:aminotransferase class III-fold pyridoxal phosphate-dependent enzyme [Bacteroidota bacterium]